MMKVIVIEPGVSPVVKIRKIEGTLEDMHKIVDGYIETLPLVDDLLCIVNEEGKLRGLAQTIYHPRYNDMLCGNVLIMKMRGEDFIGLTYEDAVKVFTMLGGTPQDINWDLH
jgi:hypothetical protein